MNMPFGDIRDNVLEIRFSSADYSIATVIAAIREHLDVLQQISVRFVGAATEVHAGPTPVFRPTDIKAIFEYNGSGNGKDCLERAYEIMWHGIVITFPTESEWSQSKHDFAQYITSQADLLRARNEGSS